MTCGLWMFQIPEWPRSLTHLVGAPPSSGAGSVCAAFLQTLSDGGGGDREVHRKLRVLTIIVLRVGVGTKV